MSENIIRALAMSAGVVIWGCLVPLVIDFIRQRRAARKRPPAKEE